MILVSSYSTLEEIKQAVDAGTVVNWKNAGYVVRLGALGYEVVCTFNGSSDPLNPADYSAADFISVA